ncbi:hypothetical protein BC567DRAFT_268609 [Phyllosticta citribraziliensis]
MEAPMNKRLAVSTEPGNAALQLTYLEMRARTAKVPVQRCIARDMKNQCRYEMHVKQVKEDMVRKIKSLEQQNANLQGSMNEREDQIEAIFDALKTSDRGPEALIRLRAGQSCEEMASWLGACSVRDVGRASPGSETRMSDIVENYESSMRLNSPCQPSYSGSILQWTSVTSDPGLLQHLTSLFFSWVHPVHMLFDEECFRESCAKGDTRYCSPALVNIICAMGCLYLVDPEEREGQSKQLLNRFLAQALEDVGKESPQNLTYAVTYCILFLVEVGRNEARKASSHLRLAVESLKSLARWEYSSEAVDVLTSAWRNDNTEIKTDTRWTPYRFPQDAFGHVASHTSIVSKQLSKLSRIINDIGSTYFAQEGRVEARSVVGIYQRLREWKRNSPAPLSMESDRSRDSCQLPHVLFVNMLYNVCLCHLLHPISDLDELPMATRDQIKSIVDQSAVEGIKQLERYRHLYTLRYQSPLLAFCVVHICVAVLQGRKSTPEDSYLTIRFGLEAMEEALPGFEYAGPLGLLFCRAVAELDLAAPDALNTLMSTLPEYGPEELLDAYKSFGDEFVQLWRQTVGGLDGKNRRQQGSAASTGARSFFV